MIVKKDKVLNQQQKEQLKVRLIVKSSSKYAVLCFYIPKKNRSLQIVKDHKKLNQHTIKDKIPLLLIEEVINKLKNAKYFNKLDLIQRYNNIEIKEDDKWGRDGIVEEPSVHVYYTYLKPT